MLILLVMQFQVASLFVSAVTRSVSFELEPALSFSIGVVFCLLSKWPRAKKLIQAKVAAVHAAS